MSLQALRSRRRVDQGELIGVPFVDITFTPAALVANTPLATAVLLPADPAALTEPATALVLPIAAPVAGQPLIQGDVCVGWHPLTGFAATTHILGCFVSTAGGPGVGAITIILVASVAVGAPAAHTVRVYLLR